MRTAPAGMHGDGGGLWLQVSGPGQRSWGFRYTSPATGKARQMGLGGADAVTLAAARDKAAELRQIVQAGRDPIADREHAEAEAEAEAARAVTFRQAAEAYIAAQAPGWRNAKHAGQWTATLTAYAFPVIGDLPAADVTTANVLAVLAPIWSTKPETAARVRGRIEAVLDYAAVSGWRAEGDNPARWRGRLQHALPARAKVAPVIHHAALPWTEASAFMAELAGRDGSGAAALRFAILTAARSGEVRCATWGEVDLGAALWTVPGARMKAGRAPRVGGPA